MSALWWKNIVMIKSYQNRLDFVDNILMENCTIPKLDGLPNLRSVILSTVDNLEPLRGLPALNYFVGNDNPDLSDLSLLADCPNLEHLSVVETAVSDISPLAGHPCLKQIVLSNTKVTDVSP